MGMVGAISGVSGLLGVCGSLLYPRLIRLVGLRQTGLIGFITCFLCMVFCLASVWAPGTPFLRDFVEEWTEKDNSTTVMILQETFQNVTLLVGGNDTNQDAMPQWPPLSENISIWLLLVGMMTARIGLWLADLSVNQLLQEMVQESERGVVGGVQYSLNRVFGLLINCMIIGLPHVHTFGIIIISSVVAWDLACLVYICFACWHRLHAPLPAVIMREHVLLRHRPADNDAEQKRRSQAEEFRKSLLQDEVDLKTPETPV